MISATNLVVATGTVPEYCNVIAKIPPQLNFEARLPSQWNGKLHYNGGGGFSGMMTPPSVEALSKGFADVGSDAGHSADPFTAGWAMNDQVALVNFAFASVPTVTNATREILKVRYGKDADRSYFEGCSNGGREALMMAQRYPAQFDGIISRAPAYNFTGLLLAFNRTAKALAAPGGAFTSGKVATLASAVRTACDAQDGIVDGVVSNPQACTFNPATLRCAGGADTGDACLSDAQLAVVQSWTTDFSLSTGNFLNTGWALSGNEDGPVAWSAWVTGANNDPSTAVQFSFQLGLVRFMLNKDPALNTLTYDPNANPGAVLSLSALLDAADPELTPFRARAGKLILWHGENDSAISYRGTVRYYTQAVNAAGGQANADPFLKLYLAPGVDHCAGGPGADTVDLLSALDAWVTVGTAPGDLTAIKADESGKTVLSRPLCRYPNYPRYKGSGDVNAASSFMCTAP
ncbi:tannase/feruloyl esterase family alpha/beta hydrolase [Stigmatella sp. ncwal1]|uniref:Tannase/feruloyl esterase family alpha/beta hydrolase n=1 Tax=Stigmatella ashevillensis TaxID=2995309 RepID=A0ABT5DN88_9BACT|nr:tannase/feruloyl esterase family alpha/beta hydrolase [Stigmatella ashevillena]MDC0715102.1 tannase/feruloyl esterase family alpha/beta hydrolase [Stigmatella ashevillena]